MKALLTALAIGILLGIATSFGQTYIPDPFKQFANSYSVWLLVSFLFGIYSVARYRLVAVCGALIQIAALAGYYATSIIRFDSGVGSTSILFMWTAGGIIGGPLLALGSNMGRRNSKVRLFTVIAMLLAILSEALYMLLVLHYNSKTLCFIGLAIVFGLSQIIMRSGVNNRIIHY